MRLREIVDKIKEYKHRTKESLSLNAKMNNLVIQINELDNEIRNQ